MLSQGNDASPCSHEDRDGLLIPGSGSTGSSIVHLRILSSLSHWQFPPGFWVPSSLVCIISFKDLLLFNLWCTVSCKCLQDTKELVLFLQLITVIWAFKESKVRPLSQIGKLSLLPSPASLLCSQPETSRKKPLTAPKLSNVKADIANEELGQDCSQASHFWV